jgi:ketosteroid isomerase-like protein
MRAAVLRLGFLVSVAAVFLAGCRQPPAARETAAPDADAVQNTVSQLEHDWVAAIVKKDVSTLEQVIADDFVGISSSGGAYTKTLAIDDVRGGQYVVEKMELTEVTVTPFGTTAIAFTTQDEASHYGTTNTSGRYRYMDVWMQRNGRWQVVASHGAKAE